MNADNIPKRGIISNIYSRERRLKSFLKFLLKNKVKDFSN